MKRNGKLYRLTKDNFESFDRINQDGELTYIAADNVPMMFWPDGRWCLEANVFIQKLFSRGLSRRDGGGTLKVYAAQLSHLIRFCANNRTAFFDLTDNQFALFIKGLVAERDRVTGTTIREPNTVIEIARVCMDFLASLAEFYDETNFIGPKGQIRAERKSFQLALNGARGKLASISYWHHNSLPKHSTFKKRLPIHSQDITKLRQAVLTASEGNMYLRKRRYVMLKLLEITGARRIEVAELTVQSVLAAAKMEVPCLKLMTAKRPTPHFRLVPISRIDLDFLIDFIKINRSRIIKKKAGKGLDDGYLLISDTTGKKLNSNTITQELSILRNTAGITGSACAHMFRHRFITKLFVALLEQHKINNKDEFRQRMIDEETLKQIVQEWTGHISKDSVARYLNLAFVEIAAFAKSYDTVRVKLALDSAQTDIDHMDEDLKLGAISATDLVEKIKGFLTSLRDDITNSKVTGDSATHV